MNNNEILKVIEMISKNETEKATQFLQEQILKSENKGNYNLVTLVKKIILTKELERTRPVLTKVQILNGVQFICDGYVAIKWKTFEPSLNILQQNTDNPINIDNVLFSGVEQTLTENDNLIINNINKVKTYLDSQKQDQKSKQNFIYLFGKVFDLNVVENVLKIMLNYNEIFDITKRDDSANSPIQLENSKIKAIILPCHIINNKELPEIVDNTNKICNILKGE
jgi:hypothetical protein